MVLLVLGLSLPGIAWQGCVAQPAAAATQTAAGVAAGTGVAAAQSGAATGAASTSRVQPAEVGSPTDPKRGQRVPLPVPANPKLPTLFLVGDSTVRNGQGNGGGGQWGWGEPLVDDFDAAKINVVNRAIGGLSSRTYSNAPGGGPWAATLALIKPGDVVLIQFGHNDGGKPDDPILARASLPGVGEETVEIENPYLKAHETVHTYGWYIRKIVQDVKAKGAIPIVCSPIPRKIWKDGKMVRNSGDFGGWARQVAAQEHVGFIDLNEIIGRRYDALGAAAVEPLFGDPHTHTSRAGAELNAECVVAGLKALASDPVAGDFSAKGAAVQAYKE
jgi:lysophospholipase L1-like esterase